VGLNSCGKLQKANSVANKSLCDYDNHRVNAYRITQVGEGAQAQVSGAVVDMKVADLSPGNVLVRVAFAGINYKDALAATTHGKVIRNFPRVGGLDFSGVVAASDDPRFREGDEVLAHSRGLGVDHDGGFATFARLPGDSLLPLPKGLSLRDAAAIGVAGYSAALCIHQLEAHGLTPNKGPVAVNGATGAVAGHAIDMLSRLGYEVHALSRKPGAKERLLALGAAQVVNAQSDAGKPLEKAYWAGAIDSVGGSALDALLRATLPLGVVVAIGNAGGNGLQTNVLPFILRGIRLVGVSVMTLISLQQELWGRLSSDLKPERFIAQTREITLPEVPNHLDKVLAGTVDGRVIVALT
jgi:acrylyl-CoA reductase (NADPH)